MMTVDPWLLDLGERSEMCAQIARRLATMQALTSSNLGHIVALNDNAVRKLITQHALRGGMATCTVRCIRCHAYATLHDWVHAASYDDQERLAAAHRAREKKDAHAAYFLLQCPGAEHAVERVDMLNDLAKVEVT
jgi:hypothetical protein